MTRRIRKKSDRQEKRTAEIFGGRTQIASGAIDGMKGDVRTGDRTVGIKDDEFLIENKFTDGEGYKLELGVWDKIEKEAIKDDMRIPLLVFMDKFGHEYVAFDLNYFPPTEFTKVGERQGKKSVKLNESELSKIRTSDFDTLLVDLSGTKITILYLENFLNFINS